MPSIPILLLVVSIVAWVVTAVWMRRRTVELEKQNARLIDEHGNMGRLRQIAEANVQIILSSMREGVVVLDRRRTVRLANPAARRLFAWPADVAGRPLLELTREPAVDDLVAAALEAGEPRDAEIELTGRKPALVLEVTVAPMREAGGEPAALAIFRDVGPLKRLEDVRREFVGNVSHELRTPLSVFQGYVEHLIDTPSMPRKEQAEVFSILQRHSKRLNALVEDLLILARLESKEDRMEREPIDVAAFAEELMHDWSLRVKEKGVTLRGNVAADLRRLKADRQRLEQVLSNLFDNALKYTPPGGTITLGAANAGPMLQLWVEDTGQGILSNHLPHIFERFYRADKARSREVGGTGLGLSIVKHIVKAHGGSVQAESTVGKGTTIRIHLPAE